MFRTRALALAGAMAVLAGIPRSSLGAQEILPADSVPSAARLAPVVVTAPVAEKKGGLLRRLGARARITELERGNRELERQIRIYDRRIEQLETHLDSLKTVAAERERYITATDSVTAQIRARRLALEARLAALEKRDSTKKAPSYGAGVPDGR